MTMCLILGMGWINRIEGDHWVLAELCTLLSAILINALVVCVYRFGSVSSNV